MAGYSLGLNGRIFQPGEFGISNISVQDQMLKSISFDCVVPQFGAVDQWFGQTIEVSYGPLVGLVHQQNFIADEIEVLTGKVRLHLRSIGAPAIDHTEYFRSA